ncbi:MAG: cytochrome P450 [Alcanivoracaceae bacterium]|nr:cytochrome P450 [Alcanivoracaceae bacterium]
MFSFMAKWKSAKQSPPGNDFIPARLPIDPFSQSFIDDPYPTLRWLRLNDPVHRCTTGAWMITRYDDVYAAFSDRRLGNSPAEHAIIHRRNRERYPCADVASNTLPFQDAPEHTQPRKIITRVFHQFLKTANVNIEILAQRRLQPFHEIGEFDVLEDYATPLSLEVMLTLFGLPQADGEKLKAWSHCFFYLFAIMPSEQIREQVDTGLLEYREYFLQEISQRRNSPGQDFISALVLDDEGKTLSDHVIADTCMLIFSDGIENVDAAIANAIVSLLQQPQLLKPLRKDPEKLERVVEECLRQEAPAQFISRVVKEEFSLHGKLIPQGHSVLLMLGSANRDESKFQRPEQIDLSREINTHLAFGRGRHSCIGARLAKTMIHAGVGCVIKQFPKLALTRAPLVWQHRLGHRWLKYLVVVY